MTDLRFIFISCPIFKSDGRLLFFGAVGGGGFGGKGEFGGDGGIGGGGRGTGDLEVEAVEGGGAEGFGADFTFPDADYAPSGEAEVDAGGIVAGDVHGYFMPPVVGVGLGQPIISATVVTMPKAAVDKYGGFVFFEHYVGGAGQTAVVDAVAQAF